jgi:hypothetical protein
VAPPRILPLLTALATGCLGVAARGPTPASDATEPDGDVASQARDALASDLPADATSSLAPDAPAPDAALPADAAAADAPPPDLAATGAFENSLGMRFLPLPGTKALISIWETRVRDFEAYAQATGAAVPHPDFPETALQPKASVSRKEAEAFATWLTAKEESEKILAPNQRYRLPTDAEWDAAIETGHTGGPFPWGTNFPPPDHFANYGLTNDGFAYTAPVGSFPPNRLGLYDLAGNLWEWIGQGCTSGGAYLVRGAGWNAHNQPYLATDFHYCFAADLVGHHNVGFRLVLSAP